MASPATARVEQTSRKIFGLDQAVFLAIALNIVALIFTFGIIYQKVEDLKEDVTAIKGILMPKPGSLGPAAPARVADKY